MYKVKNLDSLNLTKLNPFFDNLPVDPYLTNQCRFRRLSRFEVKGDRLTKLPHHSFFQSKQFNTLLGEVNRDYPELEDAMVELDDFRQLVLAFVDLCGIETQAETKVNVHQFRITCSFNQAGEPAPEGKHRDAVDFVGIFSVNRDNIQGGETQLYGIEQDNLVFSKIVNPGQFLVFNDQGFLHFTTPIRPLLEETGKRDVFVLTFPAWEKVASKDKPCLR